MEKENLKTKLDSILKRLDSLSTYSSTNALDLIECIFEFFEYENHLLELKVPQIAGVRDDLKELEKKILALFQDMPGQYGEALKSNIYKDSRLKLKLYISRISSGLDSLPVNEI